MLVSIVVPCFNSVRSLLETVASVAAQTYAPIELVLVDDGSTDGTVELIRCLVAEPGPLTIRAWFQPNSGVAAARNRGIEVARGDFILPLDADDIINSSMVADCVTTLTERPEVSIAFTDREDFGELAGLYPSGSFELERLRYFNQIPYASMYRRDVWSDVGGYRSNVDGFDDWDFWVAAALRGHRGHHVPVPHLRHRRHSASYLGSIVASYELLFAQLILNNVAAYSDADVVAARRYLSEHVPAAVLRASKLIFTNRYSLFAVA
jgi:glycosyltransferase involved in cell wall biosynthesis